MIDTKLLRQKLLDLAIRGKLVPQDPSDEPASVLLQKIREEKAALIKAGKIKKDKHESFIFRGDDNRINLLEVTSDVPPSGCLFPISFLPDKDMEYPSSIILVAQEDYEKIKNGEILLPEDWGKQDRGQEIAKEK